MIVSINKEQHSLRERASIADVLAELNITDGPGLAVALNNSVVPRKQLVNTYLRNGDALDIIHPTAGG